MTEEYYEDEAHLGSVYDRRIVGRLGAYLRPEWLLLTVSAVLILGAALLELVPQLILRHAIDNQLADRSSDGLGLLTLIFLGSIFLSFVLGYAQFMLMAFVGQRVIYTLRMDVFRHLQRMSVGYFDRNPVGRLVTRATNDIAVVEQTLSLGVVQILVNLVMVSGIIVILSVLDWRLALIMYAFLVPLIVLVRYFAIAQRGAFRDQRLWLARVNSYLNELITGVTVIQMFNRQRRSLARFDERNVGTREANMRILFWYAIFEPTVVLFGAVTLGVILWFGGVRAIDGAITLGTLIAFIAYMQRFYWPIRALSEQYTTLQAAMASAERIFSVLDEPEEIRDADEPVQLETIRGQIDFENVWFAYEPGNWVLRDLSFTLAPGDKIAVVGATGAGKSTMMALLSRFYDVQRGEIRVDGVPIRDLRQRELRRHVGVILQDPFVTTDTVLENIRLRDHTIPPARVREAATAVGANTFIERLADGYDTLLAERGANLSTGQKQLIALARVTAFQPEIVLAMDEATASIDPETESLIRRGIERVISGRTSIIVAHRLNTIRAVDRILVLHQGELVEDGTHAELVQRDGYYARLYELQYRGQDDPERAPA